MAELPGVRLISLQKGAGREELAQAREHFPVVDLGDEVDQAHGAFMDTAAIMMNLDLVITSDTAVPHLAAVPGGSGVGGPALRSRLALVVGSLRQPLVSHDAIVSPEEERGDWAAASSRRFSRAHCCAKQSGDRVTRSTYSD